VPRYLRAALFAAPGVALAVVGLTHPVGLTYESSGRWTILHVVGLFVFPLVAVALIALSWPRKDPLAWAIGLAAYVYATAYSALDVIAGITAGYVTYEAGPDVGRPVEVYYIFDIGNQLGEVGAWGFLVACVLVGVDQVRRHGLPAAVPSLVLVAAGISFLTSHIYPWRGVLTVLAIGVATGWLALLRPTPDRAHDRATAGSELGSSR
jgi:hypothetical protein